MDSFAFIPTSPLEIIAISRTLKQTHSTGVDDIKSTLISPVIELIADPLSEIFNCSLKTGVVLVLLKTGKVIPICALRRETPMQYPCCSRERL